MLSIHRRIQAKGLQSLPILFRLPLFMALLVYPHILLPPSTPHPPPLPPLLASECQSEYWSKSAIFCLFQCGLFTIKFVETDTILSMHLTTYPSLVARSSQHLRWYFLGTTEVLLQFRPALLSIGCNKAKHMAGSLLFSHTPFFGGGGCTVGEEGGRGQKIKDGRFVLTRRLLRI